jgi:dihydrofolate reductase
MLMDDELLQEAIAYYQTIDTVLFGSKTYPFLAEYWQGAEKTSDSAAERAFAGRINEIRKYVLSRSSVDLTWRRSELLHFGDIAGLAESINHLKKQKGKDISVESGLGIWKILLENALFDELLLYVQPVIVGKGERLFSGTNLFTRLNLKSTKSFNNGVLELRYEKSN